MTANAWSPNPQLLVQANANGLVKTEPINATDGQRVISLQSFAYSVGTGSVQVYKNGKVLTPNKDFVEANSTQILLTDTCVATDFLLVVGFVGIVGNPTTDTQLRSDLAASTGSNIVFFSPSVPTSSSRSVQNKLRDWVSVKDFGAVGDGVHDDTSAFELALANYKKVFMPYGNYRITRTLYLPIDCYLVGEGYKQTIMNSEVIGASTINVTSTEGTQVGMLADFQMVGNNLTGASGNGHAINFIDPAHNSGAYTPQAMVVQRMWIRYFRGQDARDNTTSTKVSAAGIICVEGLQNIYRDVLVHYCGHGIMLNITQTNKIENCTIYNCDKYGIWCYQTVATTIRDCDIVGNGLTGITDPGYPRTDLNMGNVLSCQDEGFVYVNNKCKNTGGIGQIVLNDTYRPIIRDNWIRSDGDASRAIPINHAIKAIRTAGIVIEGNTFSHVISGTSTPTFPKTRSINLSTDTINAVFNATIRNNDFVAQSGLLAEYHICLESISGNVCNFGGVDISYNRFGSPIAIGTASVIDNDIIVRNCAFSYSSIKNNIFYAQANVTRTNPILGSNLSAESNNEIQYNMFKVDSGTITTPYSGFLYPSRRMNSKTWDIPSLNAAGTAGATSSTTIAVTNAIVGEPVIVCHSTVGAGVSLKGWVSSSGTVTVEAANNTNGAIDPASGALQVIVLRSSFGEFF
jgi:hypothetical protein